MCLKIGQPLQVTVQVGALALMVLVELKRICGCSGDIDGCTSGFRCGGGVNASSLIVGEAH